MPNITIDPALTQPALRAIEPIFGAGVLAQEVLDSLNELGVGFTGVGDVNLTTRVAPLGAVSLDLAVAVYYNPNPDFIATVIPSTWDKASPDDLLAAQERGFSPVLERALASMDPAELAELAELCRVAGHAAAANQVGRPLFAGLVSRPWPEEDHLAIWHAAKLLREHRGDSHIACLVVEGLDAIDVLVIHAAWGGLPADLLRASRKWSQEAWDAAVVDLCDRGWLAEADGLVMTDDGRRRRQWIEDRTDLLAAVAYEPIGNEGMTRMIELGGKMVAALNAGGLTLAPRRADIT